MRQVDRTGSNALPLETSGPALEPESSPPVIRPRAKRSCSFVREFGAAAKFGVFDATSGEELRPLI